MVQSHNGLNQQLQTLIDDNFTTSSHSMMEEFDCHNLIKKLNEKRLIFYDIMYFKKSYPNLPIF